MEDQLGKSLPSELPDNDSTTSAVDTIVRQIQSIISDSNLKVGDSLPTERELCTRFGASRNTVREAMRILKAYGLVNVRPKIGAVITDDRLSRAFELFSFNTIEVSLKTFADVQALRDQLEVSAADQLIKRTTQTDLLELRDINGNLAKNLDMLDASEVDYAFHVRLISILGNDAMLDIYRVMKPIILRIMQKGKTRRTFANETYNEHEGVIAALEAQDHLAFQYKLRTHLMTGYKHFIEEMDDT